MIFIHNEEESISDFNKCPVSTCKRVFKIDMGDNMRRHILKAHKNTTACSEVEDLENNTDRTCKHCGKEFSQFSRLKQHLKAVCETQSVPCDICGQICKSEYTLKMHIRNIHTNETIKCPEPGCSQELKSNASLKDHIASVHRNEKQYLCLGCGKSHRYKNQRRMCENKHKGIFLYPCGICDKKYNKKKKWEEHMRVHTGEKPFQCPVCSFQSARRDNLNLHTKKSHGMTWKEAEDQTGISCNLMGPSKYSPFKSSSERNHNDESTKLTKQEAKINDNSMNHIERE